MLYGEDGRTIAHPTLYSEFFSTVFKHDCMIIVEDFFLFAFIRDVILDTRCKVICTKRGEVTSIRMSSGSRSRWIIHPKTWSFRNDDIWQFVGELRMVYDSYGDVRPTPSSLGYNMMQRVWFECGLDRHTKPNGFCADYIRQNRVGGRCDTPGLGGFFDEASMYDLSSAYLSFFRRNGTGTSIAFRASPSPGAKEFFAKCRVRIKSELPIGPFPVRSKVERGRITYPTAPGWYETYLWSSQVEDTVNAGCDVLLHGGWQWNVLTSDAEYWCERIFGMRIAAEREGNRTLAKYHKNIIVAAIGRHGGGNEFYTLVPEGMEDPDSLHISWKGRALAYFVKKVISYDNSNMIHWQSPTIVKCNSELYNFALPYAEHGKLIATNYDSVIVVEESGNPRGFPVKYTLDNITSRPGTWLWMQLHNLKVKAPRTFTSDEMTVTPGVKRSE